MVCIIFVFTFVLMNKDKIIPIRASAEEKEAFERAAELAGISVSAWARQKLRTCAISELQVYNETPAFLKKKDQP